MNPRRHTQESLREEVFIKMDQRRQEKGFTSHLGRANPSDADSLESSGLETPHSNRRGTAREESKKRRRQKASHEDSFGSVDCTYHRILHASQDSRPDSALCPGSTSMWPAVVQLDSEFSNAFGLRDST